MSFFQNLIYIIPLLAGCFLGYRLLQNLRFHVEPVLFFLVIATSYIGRSTYLLKIFDFEFILSYALVSFFVGLIAGRLIFRFMLFKTRT